MLSKPVSETECVVGAPRCVFRFLRASFRAGNRHSRTNVLLPEPLTPVTRTRRPSGNRTVRSFKLFFRAWRRVSQALTAGPLANAESGPTDRRRPRAGYFLCERRHLPVMDC